MRIVYSQFAMNKRLEFSMPGVSCNGSTHCGHTGITRPMWAIVWLVQPKLLVESADDSPANGFVRPSVAQSDNLHSAVCVPSAGLWGPPHGKSFSAAATPVNAGLTPVGSSL